MPLTAATLTPYLRSVLNYDVAPAKSLKQYLDAIPRLDSLTDIPAATVVLVRGDVDAKPGDKVGDGDIRLRSMVDTLKFGRERGWKQVIFGHIGRKPEGSLAKVAKRFGELLGTNVPLIEDWFDDTKGVIVDSAAAAIRAAEPGSVIVLQNTRKYAVERVLWDATPESLPGLTDKLTKVATEFREKLGRVYVNEAFSAGSEDVSTLVVPAAMDRAVLGKYVAEQFSGPLLRCLEAELVVFSGLKADKLDDMQAIIDRGRVKWLFVAGSLAMALKKAAAALDGGQFCMGVAEHPDHKEAPYFVAQDRIDQAKAMLAKARQEGIKVILPVDFILADGRSADVLTPTDQQLDIGPKTTALFADKIGEFIAASAGKKVAAFHNGVFGKFEEPAFESGTKNFIPQFKRMKDAGIEVYVGGGEGGAALEKYGQPDWVTHCFTAGGTVLNALGSKPVPYLVALSSRPK